MSASRLAVTQKGMPPAPACSVGSPKIGMIHDRTIYICIEWYMFSADDWSTRARRQQCGEASLEVKQRAVLYTHQRWAKALVGPHPPSEHSPQAAAGH